MSDNNKDRKYPKDYNYNSRIPLSGNFHSMTPRHQNLLTEDPHFCMIPWIHLHGAPDGKAHPCCLAEYTMPVGDFKKQTMAEVWNGDGMTEIRRNMLSGKPSKECSRCYEQEKAGFVSMRNSSSQNFGHHIALSDTTNPDGTLDWFQIRYYDVRFSNLCNFRCRSCGSMFSSNWYNDEVKLHGPQRHPRILHAGRTEDDMWEQMQEHIPYLEQIYFAGGEPLIMEEHYRILNELIKREMFHVRLVYNTNFSKLAYKDQDVLALWNKFKSVSIGASLDDSYERGEYIRKGTDWAEIVENRKRMLEVCPKVDFYISATVSAYNAWHVVDFHREWVELGFIKPGDFNVNIVQSPDTLRIDILPLTIKADIRAKVEKHIEWLEPLDTMTRATQGYRAMLSFMDSADRVDLLYGFFKKTLDLDKIRNEDFYEIFPELKGLKNYEPAI